MIFSSAMAISADNVTVNVTTSDTGEGIEKHETLLAAGVSGAFTSNDSKVTFTANPFDNSDEVALFWDGGQCLGSTVSGKSGTQITCGTPDSGDLPTGNETVIVSKATDVVISVDMDDVQSLLLTCEQVSGALLTGSGGTLPYADVRTENSAFFWSKSAVDTGGAAIPFTGAIEAAAVYNGSTTATTYKFLALLES